MNFLQLITVAVAASMISSCGASDYQLCKADMQNSFPNPEVATLSDFQAVSREEMIDRMVAHSGEARRPEVEKQSLASSEVKYYSARVSAPRNGGFFRDYHQACVVEDKSCSCYGEDDMEIGIRPDADDARTRAVDELLHR